MLAVSAAAVIFVAATSDGRNDAFGRPLGTDFSNVYAAGTFVLEGRAAAAFDWDRHYRRQQDIFGAQTQFYGWHYPPFFLFVAGALATMPYALALLVWQGATLLLYLWAIRAIVSSQLSAQDDTARILWLLLAIAFPAVLINLGHGHNGFLTAALIGGALALLDRRPAVAGLLFGLLAYKPQFGIMIPLALAATGRWRVFFSAAVTVVLLALATLLAFGSEVWRAFFDSMPLTRSVVLEAGGTGWHKIQSVFAWVRLWGGGVTLAYAAQIAATLAVAAALVRLWRSEAAYAFKAAALALAALLATPYSLDYDMMTLAPAIAFMAAAGLKHGFAPWEKTGLALMWFVPLVARSLAEYALIPLGLWTMLAMFALILHRARRDVRLSTNPVALRSS
jgi:alpha-1,2-mannosyltransferase